MSEFAWKVGDRVKIPAGELESFEGVVAKIDSERGLVYVDIDIRDRGRPPWVPLKSLRLIDEL